MDSRIVANELMKVAKILTSGDDPRDRVYDYLRKHENFFQQTDAVHVAFQIDYDFSGGPYKFMVVLATGVENYRGAGYPLINDIKKCQDMIHKVEKELRKQFPDLKIKVIE